MQESETEVVWPRKGTRPRLGRKKDSGDGTTWEKKKKKKKKKNTESEMDGLCKPRHESCFFLNRSEPFLSQRHKRIERNID